MPSKKKTPRKDPPVDKFSAEMMFLQSPASANEFTGMTPTPPMDFEEAESYSKLMGGVPVSSEDGWQAHGKAK